MEITTYIPRDITTVKDKNGDLEKLQLQPCWETLRRKILYLRYFQLAENSEMKPCELGNKIKEEFPDFGACLKMLKSCRCCHVHKLNKPAADKLLDTCDYRISCSIPSKHVKKTCSCPCRHIARHLARAHTYTGLEYVEDERHLLHTDFLNCTESQKQLLSKIQKQTQLKEKLKEKINKKIVIHPSVYTKYYNAVDELVELTVEQKSIQSKLEESKFHLQTHISDHPEVFTGADTIFQKIYYE